MRQFWNNRSQNISAVDNLLSLEKDTLYYLPDIGISLFSYIRSDIQYSKGTIDELVISELNGYDIPISEYVSNVKGYVYTADIKVNDETITKRFNNE